MSWAVQRFASVPSTMDVAREKARDGAPDGTVIVAESMESGRGQRGHTWHAPPGGLYLSMVLRGIEDPHLLTLALGNAVADALEVAGVEPQLKWVNDVWVGGRKVAGILVEAESTGSRIDFIVAGIGINANGRRDAFPADLRSIATTLEEELGCEACVPDLETFLLQSVESWVTRVREGRDAEVVEAFRRRDCLRGHEVVAADGDVQMRGIADGIDERGRLLVRGPDGATQALQSGSVRRA